VIEPEGLVYVLHPYLVITFHLQASKKKYLNPIFIYITRYKRGKMADTKIAGYILAALGLIVVALNKYIVSFLPFLSKLGNKGTMYAIVGGVALIVVGIVLVTGGKSSKKGVTQISEEVPIYAGRGKERKIVGYQKGSTK